MVMDGTLPMELSPPSFAGCNSPWRELKIHLAQLVYWYCPWRNEKLSFPDTHVAWHWYTQTPDSPRTRSSPASHNPQHTKSHLYELTRDTRKEPQLPRQIQSSAMKALKGSQLYHLNPFLDSHGIPHIRGRLRRAEIEYGEKHPITLPKTTMFHS